MSATHVFYALLVVGLVAAGVWVVRVWRQAGPAGEAGRVRALRHEFEKLTGLRGPAAYDSLERQVERQMKKRPGQSMEFYLDAVVKELRRDKR